MTDMQQWILSLLTVFASTGGSAIVTHLTLSREQQFSRVLRKEDKERRILDEKIDIEERMTRGMAAVAAARSRLSKLSYFGSRDAVEATGSPESQQKSQASLDIIDAAAKEVHSIIAELQAVGNRAAHYFGSAVVTALKVYWASFYADKPDLDFDIMSTSLELRDALKTGDANRVKEAAQGYDRVRKEFEAICDDKSLAEAGRLVVRAMTDEIKRGLSVDKA